MFPNACIVMGQNQVHEILLALRIKRPTSKPGAHLEGVFVQIALKGWCSTDQLEYIVQSSDKRLESNHLSQVHLFCGQIGLTGEFVFVPRYHSHSDTLGSAMFSAASVACYLIWLERLGFDVDPVPLCTHLISNIRVERFMNIHEITILRYLRSRHAMEPLAIVSDEQGYPIRPKPDVVTKGGYRVFVSRGGRKKPVAIKVEAPHYVEPRPQVNELSGASQERHIPA